MSVPDNMSPKKFIIYLIVGLTIFWIFIFYISYIGKKQKLKNIKESSKRQKSFTRKISKN